MTEGMGLPDGPIHMHLVGFRPDGFSPGAKIDIRLSVEAFAQLLEHGATGAVDTANLVLTQQDAQVQDSSGQLNIREIVIDPRSVAVSLPAQPRPGCRPRQRRADPRSWRWPTALGGWLAQQPRRRLQHGRTLLGNVSLVS